MELIHCDTLETSIAEGYMILELDSEFTKEKQYNVYQYFPNYIIAQSEFIKEGDKNIDEFVSWNDLIGFYKSHKKELDSFNDALKTICRKRKPSAYDLLELADTINSYYGLNNI